MASVASPETFPPGFLAAYNGTGLVVATAIIIALATVLLGLRLYVRTLTKAERGWDEFLLPISWLLLVGLGAIVLLSISIGGTGYHTPAVIDKLPTSLKIVYVLDWFYVPSNCLSRASIVLLYLRVFVHKPARIFCWAVLAFLVGNAVATLIAAQIECIPLAYIWDKTIENGWCFDTTLWWRLTNIPNIVADVAILLLPIDTVWKLHASNARKAGIAVVFLTGSIGLIASSVRTSQFFLANFSDPCWMLAGLFTWTVVECGMYFCAACLVGLRPLLVRFSDWLNATLLSRGTKVERGDGVEVNSRDIQSVRLAKLRPERHAKRLRSFEDTTRLTGM